MKFDLKKILREDEGGNEARNPPSPFGKKGDDTGLEAVPVRRLS